MTTELTLDAAALDEIEGRAKALQIANANVHLDPATVLALVGMARELGRLKGALEFLLLGDNWYLKNTCGISLPCHNGAQSVLALAEDRGWKETT